VYKISSLSHHDIALPVADPPRLVLCTTHHSLTSKTSVSYDIIDIDGSFFLLQLPVIYYTIEFSGALYDRLPAVQRSGLTCF
jgi:hypothetical protein